MKLPFLIAIFIFIAGSLFGDWIELSNRYVRILTDYDTARLTMYAATAGTNAKTAAYKPLLYYSNPLASFATISINNQYGIFGSGTGFFKKKPYILKDKIVSEWVMKGVTVVQSAGIVEGPVSGVPDTMSLTYSLLNNTPMDVTVQMRVVLDPVLGTSVPKRFSTPGYGNITKETLLFDDSIPSFWYSFDNYDNPVIKVQGTFDNATKPEKIIFSSWEKFYENKWDFQIDSSMDFRRQGTVQYDSAVGIFYKPVTLSGNISNQITLLYGLYLPGIINEKGMTLSVSVPKEVSSLPVTVGAELKNSGNFPLARLTLELLAPSNFTLAQGETNVIKFLKVDTNESRKVSWNLSGTSSLNANALLVRATALTNSKATNALIIQSEKFFTYYQPAQTLITNAVNTNTAVQIPQVLTNLTNLLTNAATTYVTPNPIISAEEKTILNEIKGLDNLIDKISIKYEILKGIYRNTYITNSSFLSDLDDDIKYFEERLKGEEESLTNDMTYPRE